MKKLLIIGGTGHVGLSLINKLSLNKNLYLTIITRNKLNKKCDQNINYILVEDYLDQIKIYNEIKNKKFDILVNLVTAGSNRGIILESSYINYINVDFANYVSSIAIKLGVSKIITFGTLEEYQGINKIPWDESSSLSPELPYPKSKIKINNDLIKLCKANSINYFHLRLASIYGVGESSNRFIPKLLEAAISRTTLKISKINIIRNYLHIDDCIDWIISIILTEYSLNLIDTINFSSDKSHSNGEIINILNDISGDLIDYKENEYPLWLMDEKPIIPSSIKRKEYGFIEKINIFYGMKQLFEYYKSK